jgi:hypothetical protein
MTNNNSNSIAVLRTDIKKIKPTSDGKFIVFLHTQKYWVCDKITEQQNMLILQLTNSNISKEVR